MNSGVFGRNYYGQHASGLLSDVQIRTEHPIQRDDGKMIFCIDMAGISDSMKVAVEFGHCSIDKLIQLKLYFDKVVWLPYWTVDIEAQRGQIGDLTKTLEQTMKTSEEKIKVLKDEIGNYRETGLHLGHLSARYFDINCKYCMADRK